MSEARWVVSVDPEPCIGSGVCVGLAPDVFRIGDDGTAVVRTEAVPGDDAAAAAEYCPARAITARRLDR